MKLTMKLTVAALLAIGLSSPAAYADTLNLTLSNPNGFISSISGGSLVYNATVSAPSSNAAAIFLNGDSFNVTAPVALNDSGFFSNFPLSLAPGASFTGGLFTLTLPANSAFGTFLGTFTIEGGSNGAANANLATVNFSLVDTPEPSSALLWMAGLAMVLGCARLKTRSPIGVR